MHGNRNLEKPVFPASDCLVITNADYQLSSANVVIGSHFKVMSLSVVVLLAKFENISNSSEKGNIIPLAFVTS